MLVKVYIYWVYYGDTSNINHTLYTLQNRNLRNYYPKPQYLIIGAFGPLTVVLGSLELFGVVEPLYDPYTMKKVNLWFPMIP